MSAEEKGYRKDGSGDAVLVRNNAVHFFYVQGCAAYAVGTVEFAGDAYIQVESGMGRLSSRKWRQECWRACEKVGEKRRCMVPFHGPGPGYVSVSDPASPRPHTPAPDLDVHVPLSLAGLLRGRGGQRKWRWE